MKDSEIPSKQQVLPVKHAGLVSDLTFSWITPFLLYAWKHQVLPDNFYCLPEDFTSASRTASLSAAWDMTPKQPRRRQRLAKALRAAYGFPPVLAELVGNVFSLSLPYIFSHLLRVMEHRTICDELTTNLAGYGLCMLIFLFQTGKIFSVNWSAYRTIRLGLFARTGLMGLIYEKSLRLSSTQLHNVSAGKVVNILSTDSVRVDKAITYLPFLWIGPIQIVVAVTLLIWLLGWPALAGFAFLLLFIPIQAGLVWIMSRYRRSTNRIMDQRIRFLRETLNGIRVVKLMALEETFQARLEDLRRKELRGIVRLRFVSSISSMLATLMPVMASVISFVCYALVGNTLEARIVFPALTYFNMLDIPLFVIPIMAGLMVDATAALKRIEEFLESPEIGSAGVTDPSAKYAVELKDADFVWTPSPDLNLIFNQPSEAETLSVPETGHPASTCPSPSPTANLKSLTLQIPRGQLVAIVGTVGSGKSSLLAALSNEMKLKRGSLTFGGSVALCSQQAWIYNATVRDNVLFGREFEEARYWNAIRACALVRDLELLPFGDETPIGEKGTSLSGGQKQRICLARLLYSSSDILLLDDPLSAVDARTGKFLFSECIVKAMAGRTRVLVSHQLHNLPLVDSIVVMDAGRIVDSGTFEQLCQKPRFNSFLQKYAEEAKNDKENGANDARPTAEDPKEKIVPQEHAKESSSSRLEEEERYAGVASWSVFGKYIAFAGGLWFPTLVLFIGLLAESVRISRGMWLSEWSSKTPSIQLPQAIYLKVYAGLGAMQGLATWLSNVVFVLAGYLAAKNMHRKALRRILRSPVAYFDKTPVGRIIQRFSNDQSIVDSQLSEQLYLTIFIFGLLLSIFSLVIYVAWPIVFVLLLPCVAQYFVQSIFRATFRKCLRQSAVASSPLLAHFSETLSGLMTLRIFGKNSDFIRGFHALSDEMSKPLHIVIGSRRWICVRSDFITAVFTFAITLICYVMRIPTAYAGLAIGYALSISGTLDWAIKQFAEVEISFISVSRLVDYASNLKTEAAAVVQTSRPDVSWPSAGIIEFKELVMRHHPHFPPILCGISFRVESSQKVAIVGRTGAGKSSILSSLFRLVEAESGAIYIDGVDIKEIGLKGLRSRLAIVPQDPVLFSGTLRFNLDPENIQSDKEIWTALEQTYMKDVIVATDSGLEAAVEENGENFSVGQRQLLCLARAILRRSKVLVMDEATANIDLQTDALIQKSLRANFSHCTILTIAHRLDTIMDYEKILVLDRGNVVEYDTPLRLLNNPNSLLSSLAAETGDLNDALLHHMAAEANK